MCRNGADWNGSVLGFEDEVFDTVCGCKEAVCGAWWEWGLTPLEDVGTPVHGGQQILSLIQIQPRSSVLYKRLKNS